MGACVREPLAGSSASACCWQCQRALICLRAESREHYLLRSTNALCLSQGRAPPHTQTVFHYLRFCGRRFFAINRRCFVSDLFTRTARTAESGPLVGGGGGGAPGPSICCSFCHFCPNCQHVRRLLSRTPARHLQICTRINQLDGRNFLPPPHAHTRTHF